MAMQVKVLQKRLTPRNFAKLWVLVLCLFFGGGLLFAGANPRIHAESAPVGESPAVAAPAPVSAAEGALVDAPVRAQENVTNTIFLPMLSQPSSFRLGLASVRNPLSMLEEIETLRAGWYLNWNVQVNPPRPGNIEFMQMIRMHQELTCPLSSPDSWSRTLCPYKEPHSYTYWPSAATIQEAAKANPGSIWLLGNEMDRRDWKVPWGVGRQDEMLPETYADAYYELYNLIKNADPTARIAIGGVIQATPLRLEYLTRIWDSYKQKYGAEMPVDIWNVHAFVLREELNGYGAETPPGIDTPTGMYTENDCSHMAKEPFDAQIRAMRQWMKDRGQQNKPLIVTEYGVLYNSDNHEFNGTDPCADPAVNPASAEAVRNYMLWTFDYFLNTKDEELGYPADDYRLVQRWSWFSVDHLQVDENGNVIFGINQYGSLYNGTLRSLTQTGKEFRQYSLTNLIPLSERYD